jgi:UDP-N-acetylglucosamine 2-epimerase (non-hydrolysing)
VVTDRLARLHLTPSPDADANLLKEGADPRGIVRVGNCMIDSVLRHLPRARALDAGVLRGLQPHKFVLATLHRPSNVDEPAQLLALIKTLKNVAALAPVLFPVHPRTRARLQALDVDLAALERVGLTLIEPVGYLEFLRLQDSALAVITDSGGVQEETTALGVPCLTVRDNTERPITAQQGTNKLIGRDPAAILPAVRSVLEGQWPKGQVPELWDGKAGVRAAAAIVGFLHE